MAACSKDALEFSPTDSGSGDKMLQAAGTAITSINGIYRSMWTAGWSTGGNTHQCFGIAAYNLAQDAMADDFIMQGQGNGWFWYDHIYNVKSFYTSDSWRSYDVWRAYYKWIADSNYVIDAGEAMSGEEEDVAFVVGQAFAIRGMSYLYLAEWFARPPYNPITGEYRWSEPGVPIYTTGTGIKTGGAPRSNLEKVYERVNKDLDSAIVLLGEGLKSTLNKNNKSQISLYTALGLKSRSCLATGDWEGAYNAAMRVIKEGDYTIGTEAQLMSGMNSIAATNVMWGAGIENSEQSGAYAGFFTHMDCVDGAYGQSAPKLINSSLYNHIGAGDIRRAWWDPTDKESPYVTRKFKFSNVASCPTMPTTTPALSWVPLPPPGRAPFWRTSSSSAVWNSGENTDACSMFAAWDRVLTARPLTVSPATALRPCRAPASTSPTPARMTGCLPSPRPSSMPIPTLTPKIRIRNEKTFVFHAHALCPGGLLQG